jgi:hypothetical protein
VQSVRPKRSVVIHSSRAEEMCKRYQVWSHEGQNITSASLSLSPFPAQWTSETRLTVVTMVD